MSLSFSLSHDFGAQSLDIRFDAPTGLTVLFGPSGSGKTSVVRAVAGLFRPDHCEITLESERLDGLPASRRGMGVVFQDHRLFPHLNVQDNLRYGARFARGGGAALSESQVIDMLGLGDMLDRRIAALSGGESARVALGRALLARPRMILADEPLASLDAARKSEILPFFERLRDELQLPILYVSHSAGEVARLATTVVALSKGRVVRAGPALEVLADPQVLPLGPRGAGAAIMARVVAHHADGLTELDAGGVAFFVPKVAANAGAALRLRIAAQDILLSDRAPEGLSALNVVPGQIASLREGDGPGAIAAIDTQAGRLLARITARSAKAMGLAPGAPIWAIIKSVAVAPEDIGG